MNRGIAVYLKDILESIEKIEQYLKPITKDEFLVNSQVQDAIFRRLEIIGEAVKNMPESVKKDNPGVPWKAIAGLRDILIHQYFGVNAVRTWKTAQEDIPALKDNIQRILGKTED